MKFIRYRFKTRSVNDFRPLEDLAEIQMPWWCTGESDDGSYMTIVCYLPAGENLLRYWDDAFDIDADERNEISYTERFPKPSWIE